jgi:hypothetical protein
MATDISAALTHGKPLPPHESADHGPVGFVQLFAVAPNTGPSERLLTDSRVEDGGDTLVEDG